MNRISKTQAASRAVIRPTMDIVEREGGIFLYLDLPGVEKEDLIVESQGNDLLVDAYTSYGLDDNERLHNLEFAEVRYQGKFSLPDDVDRHAISAELRNGVLMIFMPKRGIGPERIMVKVT